MTQSLLRLRNILNFHHQEHYLLASKSNHLRLANLNTFNISMFDETYKITDLPQKPLKVDTIEMYQINWSK